MVISPEEAAKITEFEERCLKDLEGKIDQHLKIHPNRREAAAFQLPYKISLTVRQEITKIYENAGWKVQYGSHSSNGVFIFSKK